MADDLFDGAPEVDVEHVRVLGVGDRRGLADALDLAPVDLDRDGPLLLVELELLDRRLGPVDQAAGRDELGREEVRAEPLAEDPERRVGHVLHRGEDERAVAEVEVSDAHGRAWVGVAQETPRTRRAG